MVLVEIMMTSARLALASKVTDLQDQAYIQVIVKGRQSIEKNSRLIKRGSVKPITSDKASSPKLDNLVLKAAGQVQNGTSASKFTPKVGGAIHCP